MMIQYLTQKSTHEFIDKSINYLEIFCFSNTLSKYKPRSPILHITCLRDAKISVDITFKNIYEFHII